MGRILLRRRRTSTSQVTPRLRCIWQERFTRGQICYKSGGKEIGLVVVKLWDSHRVTVKQVKMLGAALARQKGKGESFNPQCAPL